MPPSLEILTHPEGRLWRRNQRCSKHPSLRQVLEAVVRGSLVSVMAATQEPTSGQQW